jgi:hypothetical protein
MEVKILKGLENGSFPTTTARTNVPQIKKLELTMKNLCSVLGIKKIYWQTSSRNAKFYRPDGQYSYQSASNTILELSEKISEKYEYKNA